MRGSLSCIFAGANLRARLHTRAVKLNTPSTCTTAFRVPCSPHKRNVSHELVNADTAGGPITLVLLEARASQESSATSTAPMQRERRRTSAVHTSPAKARSHSAPGPLQAKLQSGIVSAACKSATRRSSDACRVQAVLRGETLLPLLPPLPPLPPHCSDAANDAVIHDGGAPRLPAGRPSSSMATSSQTVGGLSPGPLLTASAPPTTPHHFAAGRVACANNAVRYACMLTRLRCSAGATARARNNHATAASSCLRARAARAASLGPIDPLPPASGSLPGRPASVPHAGVFAPASMRLAAADEGREDRPGLSPPSGSPR